MAAERPPVLHVAPFLWSGAGSVITRLCEHQRRSGAVAIVTTSRSNGLEDWPVYRRRLRRAGVTHHTIDFFHREPGVFWPGAEALANLYRQIGPAVVHAHAGVPACGAVVARAISGVRPRIVGQMYSWGPDRPEWMNRQDAWGLGETDRVICSAHEYGRLLVEGGVPKRKIAYLPWGLALDELPLRDPRRRAPAAPVIGFVGRIEPRKGQLTLVEAFARLRRELPTARLELVGPVADEAYAGRVRDAIARHGLGRAVNLAGEVRDVRRHLRGWDLFVSLSSDEGQGLAVLEAMAIGVPVVARSVAGVSDYLVDGRTGIALGGGSVREAAAAIETCLTDSERMRTIGRQARSMMERRYSWNRTTAAFDRIYWR